MSAPHDERCVAGRTQGLLQAVEAFRLCGAKQAIGHHWGTFRLADEGYDDPPRKLTEALSRTGLASQTFSTLLPGSALQFTK
jgi:hypothetical protein